MVPETLGSAVTAARGKNEHYLRRNKGDLFRAQEMQSTHEQVHSGCDFLPIFTPVRAVSALGRFLAALHALYWRRGVSSRTVDGRERRLYYAAVY